MAEDESVLALARRKFIDAKRRWAEEGRLLTGETAAPVPSRLPPGQREVKNWPILDLGNQPAINQSDWRLTIDGLVDHPLVWDWPAFMAQPQMNDVSDMHCVTSWSRFANSWRGVAARHVLALVRPRPAAAFVIFHSYDGYVTNLPLKSFDDDDVMLAHSWEGKPLTRPHGGPVRALVPKLYLWKSAKWLTRIQFVARDRPGFWEERGYHDVGDPWLEQRYGHR
jgi:DMSO/TMAO reductase YedYZ molybdopterin-dependent catalytic subunit